MSTIRRMYFYGISLISVLVVVWGVVLLLQTLLSGDLADAGSDLAGAISMVVVGLPIFLLHWRVVQRDAARDEEERTSRVRAVFLYAAQAAALGPVVFQILELINRGLARLLGISTSQAWFSVSDRALDIWIAMAVNLVALAFFVRVTRGDWAAPVDHANLQGARRLYRYLWMLTGLSICIAAVYTLLRYLLELAASAGGDTPALAGGLSLLLVGVPVLVIFWRAIQAALSDADERRSLLRLVVLYAVSLAGVIGVLSTAGSMLTLLLRWIMGGSYTLASFLRENSGQIGLLVPLGLMWWYFGGVLNREVAALEDQPRRAALRRLYYYILSLLGLTVTYAGLIALVGALTDTLFEFFSAGLDWQYTLSGALSSVLVGMPLWLLPWRLMQAEARRSDDAGDHARRSVVRKTYLYLVLFGTVITSMGFSGQLMYLLIDQVLGSGTMNFLADLIELAFSLAITAGLLVYHWRELRRDGQVAQTALADLHRAFPVWLLSDAPEADAFAGAAAAAVGRSAPEVPLRVVDVRAAPPEDETPRAVVFPAALAAGAAPGWQRWLQEFPGRRLAVPLPAERWTWLGQNDKPAAELAHETARAVRQMAEGEIVRQGQAVGPWSVFLFLLGGVGGVIVLSILFAIMTAALYR